MRSEDSLEKALMLGRVAGKRRRGRQRTRWLDTIKEDTGMQLQELKEAVNDRKAWRVIVHRVTKSRKRLNG